MKSNKNKVAPFSDNPIMIGYDSRLFDFDIELGYVFPNDQIVGQKGFITFENKINKLKKYDDKRFLVLSIGDSATSGWNSDNVFKGCTNPETALFSYNTYSDILERKHEVGVINAGVPGYTTYQAKKYVSRVLRRLAQRELWPDYVTIYLGNNDCAFNGLEDKTRIDYKNSSSGALTRVSETDFVSNYRELLETVGNYGAKAIILMPVSNFKWEPGLRSRKHSKELEQQRQKIPNGKVRRLFIEAERAYKIGDYELALEKDLLLPRIKKSYKSALKQLAIRKDVDVVDVQDFAKDEEYFIDYCHPAEKLNEQIAQAITALLKKKSIAKHAKPVIESGLPTDTYTLY